MILRSFQNVDPIEHSSMLSCELQGHMMHRLLIRCSALLNASISSKCLAWLLIFEAYLALNTIFDLYNFMSFQVTVLQSMIF